MTAKSIFSRCMVIVALGILLLGIGGLPSQAKELDPDPAATVRISEASDGTQANSSSGLAYPSDTNSISVDGRFIAFSSSASNLVDGDTNGTADVFVRDRDPDGDGIFDEPGSVSITRVSVTSSGGQANRNSYQPTISSDGRFVAFTSTATNLDPSVLGSDDYMDEDIFVHDRLTGSTRQLSVRVYPDYTNDGNQHSSYPSISGDGSVVAYQSSGSNLADGDTNIATDVYVVVRVSRTNYRVSVSSAGEQANSSSTHPHISPDGRFVTFRSFASNLVDGDENVMFDIFVRDRQLGTTELVSVHSNGAQANNESANPFISSDGRYVVFESKATNLVDGDAFGNWDIFLHDRQLHETRRVSVRYDGTDTSGSSYNPSISNDGRYVAFVSSDYKLVSDDHEVYSDVFVRDLVREQTVRLSLGYDGAEADRSSREPVTISSDGWYVAFASEATNLVPGDTNGMIDIFAAPIPKPTPIVNSTGDAPDANPADDACDTGNTTGSGSPECTLRAAIQTTNAMGGGTIRFNIPSTGFPTISPGSPLPEIIATVKIDGKTQPYGMVELDGTNAGASADGLHITAGGSLVQGLIINRFGGEGIYLGTAGGNTIRGNYIGVDQTGTLHAANGYGIAIDNSPNNTIGGTGGEYQRNLISGNTWAGVIISGASSTGNRVQNNYIGVNKYGSVNLFNDGPGVSIEEASSNTIGGTTAEQRNIISGNKVAGVRISGSGATGNKVQGNYIGVQANGTGWMANTGPGVRIVSGSSNQVGGTDSGAGNVIAFNTGEGVLVEWGEGNAILSNSIHSNEKLGIDLWGDGITANDPGDGDTGPNSQQNFPTFTDMRLVGAALQVSGILSSTANTTFRLEFFSGEGFKEDGSVQGRDYRASVNVTTDATGYGTFTVSLLDAGTSHTATATRLDASGQPLHTSEFTPVDVAVIGLEVTQSIQDMANSVSFVAEKTTYALLHVRALGATQIPNVRAQLSRMQGGSPVETIYSIPETLTVGRLPRRYVFQHAFYFVLPDDWIQAGALELEAEVNFEPRTLTEASYDNNDDSETIEFTSEPDLNMRIYDIHWFINPGINWKPRPEVGDQAPFTVAAMFPLPGVNYERRYMLYASTGDTIGSPYCISCVLVNLDLAEARSWARLWGHVSDDWVFYGIVPRVSTGASSPLLYVGSSGDGYGEYSERWMNLTIPHELGHIFGRKHTCTPNGGETSCDSGYPYPNGLITWPVSGDPFSEYVFTVHYGYDATSQNPRMKHDNCDIMSYANLNDDRWISDFTWNGLREWWGAASLQASQPLQSPGEYLLATGQISLTHNTASFDSLTRVPDLPAQPAPAPGPYELRLLDGGGVTLASYPFAADPLGEIPQEYEQLAMFSLLTPYITGTAQIQVISDTQVIASRLVSSQPPTAAITYPQGGEVLTGTLNASWTASDGNGDDLTFTVFYSADDGQTWDMVATGWPSVTIPLDTTRLEGSAQARLRILANDGVNAGIVDSPAFEIAAKPPEPMILLPEDGRLFETGELVKLEGTAWDTEDGTLADSALTWTDSDGSLLGTGSVLFITSLSPGWHTITLTATDSDGMSMSVNVTIRVGWTVYLPVAKR